MRIIFGIPRTSAAVYGWCMLERLRNQKDVTTHPILITRGQKTLSRSVGKPILAAEGLSDFSYLLGNTSIRLAGRLLPTDDRVIAPSSIHALPAMAYGSRSSAIIAASIADHSVDRVYPQARRWEGEAQ